MSNVTSLQREHNAIVRTAILAFINAKHQVSVIDLCGEFQMEEGAMLSHLRAMNDQHLAHRAVPMTFSDCAAGQIWTTGPKKPAGEDIAEPIQVTVLRWKPQQLRVGLLESLWFAPQGVPA